MNAIIIGIRPVLDFIDGNLPLSLVGDLDTRSLPSDAFVKEVHGSLDAVQGVHPRCCMLCHRACAHGGSLPLPFGMIDTDFARGTSNDDVDRLAD